MALARAWKQMSWFYYQYLLVTALYMLEPWERTVFSILPGPRGRGPGGGAGARAAPSQAQRLRVGGAQGGEVVRSARGAHKDWSLHCGRAGRRCPGEGGTPGWGGGGRARSLEIRGRSVFISGRNPLGRWLTWPVLARTSAAPAFGSVPCSCGRLGPCKWRKSLRAWTPLTFNCP